MTIEKIIDLLNNFKPFEDSDPDNDNLSYLDEIMEELKCNEGYEKAFDPIFRLMEKYPDADLGSPGPLVHTLEKFRGTYEQYLMESLHRRPTPLTAWMLNRIINAEERLSVKAGFVGFMVSLSQRNDIDTETRDAIEGFISFQRDGR